MEKEKRMEVGELRVGRGEERREELKRKGGKKSGRISRDNIQKKIKRKNYSIRVYGWGWG